MDKLLLPSALSGALLLSPLAQAALIAVDLDANSSNGHEVLLDNQLQIYWLADANLAASNNFGVSGINANGSMSWDTAQNFVTAMNNYNSGAGYLGINHWRQAQVTPLNGSSYSTGPTTYDGSSDQGYQISAAVDAVYNPFGQSSGSINSELAFNYYNNLGAIGACNGSATSLNSCVSHTVYGIDDASNAANLTLFNNLQNSVYWSGSELGSNSNNAFRFANMLGLQDTANKMANYFVMPVADVDWGNYSRPITDPTVPLPASAWLFASALAALSLLPRQNKQRSR